MVDCARFAPSSVNAQPFKYLLAWEKEKLDLIQPLTGWARNLPEKRLPYPGKRPTGFIVVCQDTDWDPDLTRYLKDVGIVAQTMLLTAVEMGLGGCMIGSFNAGGIHSALGLDESIRPMLVVAVGKPDEEVILTDAVDGKTGYYRDDKDRHYVPKRPLEELVLPSDRR